jgi:DNA mismatch repair protein MutL
VLSPEVAHRIAAGEVIERPASAVKELIENSLDAGASRIEVEIEDGGISLIRVSDDGSGMSPEDAGRAVTEHATSKIRTADDLASVASLGFRGEALHAIGAVSDLTLITRKQGTRDSLGARVRIFAGEVVESTSAAHPRGTTVEARDLFLNLPVRRGFLGTVRAEATAVCTVVESLALSRPEVGFFLRSDGRRSLALPAAADLRERISQVHGLSLARSLIALEDPVVWGVRQPARHQLPDPPLPARRREREGRGARLLRACGGQGLRRPAAEGAASRGVRAARARPRRGGRQRASCQERRAVARWALDLPARGRDHQVGAGPGARDGRRRAARGGH